MRANRDALVLLSRIEEEYLVRASETAIDVRKLRQFYLWTQGQLQGLLPHQLLVCLQFGDDDALLAAECVDRQVRDAAFVRLLCDAEHGLAVRLARHWRTSQAAPCVLAPALRAAEHPLALLQAELTALGLHTGLAHGTERLRGGASFFALFALGETPTARHAFFLEVLLPVLHLAFQRVQTQRDATAAPAGAIDALTAREQEILTWVMRGKSNYEIGAILDLSALTVKNHLQKIYRKLNVHNRVQAVSRCWDLSPPARP